MRFFAETSEDHVLHIELSAGDIAFDGADVVTSACGRTTVGPSAVALALLRGAGPELAKSFAQCVRDLPGGQMKPGECVLTSGFGLRATHVAHCLPPEFAAGSPSVEVKLADCYRSVLRAVRDYGARSVAFPSLGTGAYGFPLDVAAPIAARTIRRELWSYGAPALVRFVLPGAATLDAYARAFSAAGLEPTPLGQRARTVTRPLPRGDRRP